MIVQGNGHNAVISIKKPLNDPRFNPLGKSRVNGGYLYEVEYSAIDIRNNPPPECAKLKLLSPQEMQMEICPWEYVKSKNIYDPYNYKAYYQDDGKSK
jgi:hypothetical protein